MMAASPSPQSIFTNNLASGGSSTNAITEGSAGGAIDSQGASLTVTDCVFSSNQAVGPATGTGEGNGGAAHQLQLARDDHRIDVQVQSGGCGPHHQRRCHQHGRERETSPPRRWPSAIARSPATRQSVPTGPTTRPRCSAEKALGGAIANAGPLTIANSTFTDNGGQGR